jgi:hypothetical protein
VNLSDTAKAAREAARKPAGQFGEQQHSAPEAELTRASTDPRSPSLTKLLAEITELDARKKLLESAVVEEHIIDAARALPAEVRRVIYRVDPENENGPEMLMFEFAETQDGDDLEGLDPSLREQLYDAGFSFGMGEDLDYRGWVSEIDDCVALDFGEDEADRLIDRYQADIRRDMDEYGIVDPQLRRGLDAWLERSIRMKAADTGIARLHLRFAEDGPGSVEVVWFETAGNALIAPEMLRPDPTNPDDVFILDRVQKFGYRSAGMKPSDQPDAPLTLEV